MITRRLAFLNLGHLALVALVVLASPAPAQRAQAGPRLRGPSPRSSGTFELVSCSLGCVPGSSGFACRTSEIHQNDALRFTFNQPVALASVDAGSFQVFDLATGRTPPGSLHLDPLDPNTLVYRPQMSFDSAGNPLFGLQEKHVYLLRLPGLEQDPLGPFVTSVDLVPNRIRLQCQVIASLGVSDAVPGRPTAKITVQAVVERDPVSGEPIRFATVPAEGAGDVSRDGPIDIVFADLMNPATIANPVTGQSSFIRVFFDPDGDVTNVSDQVPVPGSLALSLDQERLTTRARFQADGRLPAAGLQRNPARIVVLLSPQIEDLGANRLANPGRTSFFTEAR